MYNFKMLESHVFGQSCSLIISAENAIFIPTSAHHTFCFFPHKAPGRSSLAIGKNKGGAKARPN